ncbi:MAG TPA: glycosyltransferase family 4 protein [Gemmatimonadaceae bacterium]|jgi:glycosyltransferase involved in cell wall biosynthesis|nr:glycosyltransferase family 4 protein [Gemmatimonadaceae bacterium]
MSVDPSAPRTIAHFMPWAGIGGTEHATLRIARAVQDRGFHSIAFCRDDAPEVHEFFRSADVPTVPYHLTEFSVRRPLPFARNTRAIARDLDRLGVDLLHCADVDAGIEAGLAGGVARLPVLCHVRNPVLTVSRRERMLLSPVSRFVFVSRDTWTTFGMTVGPERGRVLYDGIVIDADASATTRAEVRRELSLGADTPVVGMTARVSPQKDYLTLARAAVKVRESVPDVRFVIVGDYSEHAAHREHFAMVREELVRLGVLESFVFAGFRSDVARVMSAFDVFVLSTHFEGLPLVVLEAMSLGLPVVATAVNGIPEVIDREEVGLLHAHEDPDALARQLLAVLTDRSRAARIGAAGRESVRQRFGMEAFAENVTRLYREALSGRR